MNNNDDNIAAPGTPEHEAHLKTLREIVKDIDFAMLTTLDDDGTLRSRPMSSNKEIEFDGDLWFFTYASSHKVDEVEREHQVGVSFADPKTQRYVSMSGAATLVRDKAKIEELWQPHLKAWFPKGTDEPDIALLKVNVSKAEYWDAPSSFVAHAVGLVKATLTGTPASGGENEKLDLSPVTATSR